MQNYRNGLERMVYFTTNYPPDFIDKIWGGTELCDHFKDEFNYHYDKYGSIKAFIYFYCALDMNNREKMDEFINNW